MPQPNIRALFKAALAALRTEDESLQKCFKKSDTTVAHGLTYWLFETTLVYLIFKAWLPKANVYWEHALEREVARRPNPTIVGRSGAHEKCDLAIRGNGADGRIVAAFEAKWWNNSSTKTKASLIEDANKLRRGFPDPAVQKYLLTFWWGHHTAYKNDLAGAKDTWRREDKLKVIDHGTFDTKLIDGDGYFALGLLQVG